jgi:hypothetical protein
MLQALFAIAGTSANAISVASADASAVATIVFRDGSPVASPIVSRCCKLRCLLSTVFLLVLPTLSPAM